MPSLAALVEKVDRAPQERPTKIAIEGLSVSYGDRPALKDVWLTIRDRETTALIGPSGCGKTTLLRCLNRLIDEIRDTNVSGRILLDGTNIMGRWVRKTPLRRRFAMVAQKPDPFRKSVYDNIAFGARIRSLGRGRADYDQIVEAALVRVGLWDEVKDQLNDPAPGFSIGQQQRLCIARAIAVRPEIILMDEPCSNLDPVATARVEALIDDLSKDFAIVLINHDMRQAARVAQRTAFFLDGRLIEVGETRELFTNAGDSRTRDYVASQDQ